MPRRNCAFPTCLLPALKQSPNSPLVPARIHPASSVCCAHSALWKCSRPHATVVSATRHSPSCFAPIIPNRSVIPPCFCLHLFFGARSESFTNLSGTGDPVFERIFGQSFFDYLAAHPADAAVFNAVMTQGIAWTTPALLAAYDFSGFERLVDVGGGEGALLSAILKATPRLHGVLFDLPQVVARSSEILTGDIAVRCQVVGGSFFDSVPEGADAYVMKGVIHDWPDNDAATILRNTRSAMRPDGILLLIEEIVDSAARPVGVMELLMLVIGGRERTEADFRSLLAATGFSLTRIIPTEASSLIECHPE